MSKAREVPVDSQAGHEGVGRIILVRHGESEGNEVRQFSVSPDIELTARGREQATAAGRTIAAYFEPAVLVASPFRRARITAELIGAELGHAGPVRVEEDLRERSIGELAGAPYDAMHRHPTYRADRFWEWRPSGGESLEDVARRAGAVLDRLAAEHRGRDVVVVSHGGTMLALCAHVEGDWTRPRVARNCEIVVVRHTLAGGLELALDEPRPAVARGESADDATG
ncbi:MAG: histidine phosphatase family protein [Alphaproteobacteria bacterium]